MSDPVVRGERGMSYTLVRSRRRATPRVARPRGSRAGHGAPASDRTGAWGADPRKQ
jgi:hypothetical protein